MLPFQEFFQRVFFIFKQMEKKVVIFNSQNNMSVESQKGIIIIQWGYVENQRGTIAGQNQLP